MPIDYSKYHPDWKTKIRPSILARANNCCEVCGVANYAFGYRGEDGTFYDYQFIEDELEMRGNDMFDNVLKNCFDKHGNPPKGIKIVLTIAHLNHDVNDNRPENLKAMCQYHHLRYDVDEKKRKRFNKIPNLFTDKTNF